MLLYNLVLAWPFGRLPARPYYVYIILCIQKKEKWIKSARKICHVLYCAKCAVWVQMHIMLRRCTNDNVHVCDTHRWGRALRVSLSSCLVCRVQRRWWRTLGTHIPHPREDCPRCSRYPSRRTWMTWPSCPDWGGRLSVDGTGPRNLQGAYIGWIINCIYHYYNFIHEELYLYSWKFIFYSLYNLNIQYICNSGYVANKLAISFWHILSNFSNF